MTRDTKLSSSKRQLARNDRAGARQATEPRQIADKRQDGDKHHQLEGVVERRLRQHSPQEPENRLRPAHGPHRTIEVTALVPLALGRRLDARQLSERAEQPDAPRQREIVGLVHLLERPVAGEDRHDQAGDIQDGEADHLTPRHRVADAPVERVRAIFSEADDVGLWLDTRQRTPQSGYARPEQHRTEPQRHSRIETMFEQIEGQRTRRDEEHEYPDRPVVEPVVQLVALADLPIGRVFDRDGWHGTYVFIRDRPLHSIGPEQCPSRRPDSTNPRPPESECGRGDPRIASACALNPSPSAPTSSAMRAPDDERANSARLNAGSRGVSATIVNPWSRRRSSAPGHASARAKGTRSVAPIDVRIALRYSGSQHAGLRTTPPAPNAAALRKTPPRLSALPTFSSTTIARDAASASRPTSGRRSASARHPR